MKYMTNPGGEKEKEKEKRQRACALACVRARVRYDQRQKGTGFARLGAAPCGLTPARHHRASDTTSPQGDRLQRQERQAGEGKGSRCALKAALDVMSKRNIIP